MARAQNIAIRVNDVMTTTNRRCDTLYTNYFTIIKQ